MKNTPSRVAATVPDTTAVPSTRRAFAPAPDADHSGSRPNTNASDVITIGRSRSLHAWSVAS